MVIFINEVNKKLMASIEKEVKLGRDVNVKEYFEKFTMDTIATCAFGVDAQSFSNEDSQFVKMAKAVFRRTTWENLTIPFMFIPGYLKLMQALKVPLSKVCNYLNLHFLTE